MADNTLSAASIRRRFIEFFSSRGHTSVPSSPLVPHDDPTLLFVNAGMNQFKDVFTGRETRPYSRAVTVQKCLRAGGKHNDLENVGFTPRHQTLFEMLGNFSFGDYFKQDAIAWAWEFLTQEMGVPKERLVVTVFDGTGENADADDEAAELWAAHIDKSRIYRCSASENFWSMGDTGPCGPCSEIHIFNGDVAPGTADQPGTGPEFDEKGYLELWNLVFMQYEKFASGEMKPLPKPSIDTGAGLERIAATVAGADSNYGTTLLSPMVERARALAGEAMPSGAGESPLRVIADHARATAFLIADGVFPDRTGRSYVLRRIMRRAIRHGTDIGLTEPFMHEICREVVQTFGEDYPELAARASTIEEVVRGEEDAFRRTLDRGLRRLRGAIDTHDRKGSGGFSPEFAADLYRTYGFPLDLTAVILREHGLSLDEQAADKALKEVQGAAGGRGVELGQASAVADVYFKLHETVGDTEFCGYPGDDTDAAGESTVLAVVVEGARVDAAIPGTEVEVVLDRSAMYAESGGQVGDTGVIVGDGDLSIEVTDTVKPVAGLSVHRGRVSRGSVREGQSVRVRVDADRRAAIQRNHSATHLLHFALREVLGEHVVQKGSLVTADRLRFDFSHSRAVTWEQRQQIERRVNEMVVGNAPTGTQVSTVDEAKAEGAMMLFGEKYAERVRVVRIGADSVELCGGTHVQRAGDIGLVALVSEGGIAAGVRRIEAVTGPSAIAHLQSLETVAAEAAGRLHAPGAGEIVDRIERLLADVKDRDRKIGELQQKLATGGGGGAADIVEVDGVKLLAKRVSGADAKSLRAAADALRGKLGSGVVVLGADAGGKATLLVAVTKDLAKGKVHAGKLVGALAVHVDGRGGGRPDFAQAGGPSPAGLDNALGAASAALRAQLGA